MKNKKTVIVTGGAKGIGAAISQEFATQGDRVLINYKSSQKEAMSLQARLQADGFSVAIYQADISKKKQVQALVAYCEDQFGSPHVLVNNAGVAAVNFFDAISEEEWDHVMDTNLKGVFFGCQAVVPAFIRQKSGVIINIASIWGWVGAACEVHYSAAKAGVIGLTKALAKELGPSNIRVNCVAPGVIQTDMLTGLAASDLDALRQETPLQRLGTPLEIAKAVFFLASEDAAFITGQVLSPNGGFVIA